MAEAVRLQVTEAGFQAFCTALAAERAEAGAGPGARIGIGPRSDVLAVIAALNGCGGWLVPGQPPGSETGEAAFARHLAPILCENPAMLAALNRVLSRDGVPGVFQPSLPRGVTARAEVQDEPTVGRFEVYRALLVAEVRWRWMRFRNFAATIPGRAAMAATALAVVALLTFPMLQGRLMQTCASFGTDRTPWPLSLICSAREVPLPPPDPDPPLPFPNPDEHADGPVVPVMPDVLPRDLQLGPLHRALTALERTGFDRSPRQVAEYLAATGTIGLDPALYLDAMLTRWPLAADRPIPRSRTGALALASFALAVAELEGDAGAIDAMRQRLTVLTGPAPTGSVTLPDGTTLPDAPRNAEEAAISLPGLSAIDPRLARLSVDDVVLGAAALAPVDIFADGGTSPQFQVQSIQLGQQQQQQQRQQQQQQQQQQQFVAATGSAADIDLRTLFAPSDLASYADRLRARFGVDPGFDPAGDAPVTFTGIVAAIREGLEAEAPLEGTFRDVMAPWPAAVGLAALVPLILAVVWAVLGYRGALRRRLARLPPLPPPEVHLVVPAPNREAPALALAARKLAPRLRYTPPRATTSLDVEASLARTLQQGGYFEPVQRTRRDVATHVVLIHRRTMAEHQPRRIAALFGQLQAAGVSMVLYEYAADPARLRPFGQPGGALRDLEGLAQDHPDARLILVTTGDEFAGSGAYGVSAATVRALWNWPRRAVVTPVPLAAWGVREWALSARLGAPLARAGAEGVGDLAAIFPDDPQRRVPGPTAAPGRAGPGAALGWLRQMRDTLLPGDPAVPLPALLALSEAEAALPRGAPPERIEAQVVTLRRWLGPRGFLWLQACASYPVLRYPLTRWLGERLFGVGATPRLFAQLTQLPWFAVGRMPAPLALRLRQALAPADAARIEGLFTEFFARHAVEGPSPAQDAGRRYGSDRMAYEPDALSAGIPGARQLPAAFAADPAAEAGRQRRVRLAMLVDRGAVVAAAGLLTAGLWLVWPNRNALPLAPGAWMPAVATVVLWMLAGMAAVVGLAALRRARRTLQATPAPARGAEGAR